MSTPYLTGSTTGGTTGATSGHTQVEPHVQWYLHLHTLAAGTTGVGVGTVQPTNDSVSAAKRASLINLDMVSTPFS